jgi:hypothetical protein
MWISSYSCMGWFPGTWCCPISTSQWLLAFDRWGTLLLHKIRTCFMHIWSLSLNSSKGQSRKFYMALNLILEIFLQNIVLLTSIVDQKDCRQFSWRKIVVFSLWVICSVVARSGQIQCWPGLLHNCYVGMWNQVCQILSESSKGIRGARVEHNRFCVTIHFRCVKEEVTLSLSNLHLDWCTVLFSSLFSASLLCPSSSVEWMKVLVSRLTYMTTSLILLLLSLGFPRLVNSLSWDGSSYSLGLEFMVCKLKLYYV